MRPAFLIATLAVAATLPATLAAQTATAIKTGERTTGQTKQCYYEFAGSEYTKTMHSYDVCPVTIQVKTTSAPQPQPQRQPEPPTVTAIKTGEETTGQTKQCYYEFAGSKYTKTMRSYEVCPVTIQVRNP